MAINAQAMLHRTRTQRSDRLPSCMRWLWGLLPLQERLLISPYRNSLTWTLVGASRQRLMARDSLRLAAEISQLLPPKGGLHFHGLG